MHQRKTATNQKKGYTTTSNLAEEIPEDEKWRLINETGILRKADSAHAEIQSKPSSLGEEIFDTVTIIIPISSVLLLMEMLIHYQYGQRPTVGILTEKMISGVPILSVFIFYTTRHKALRKVQLLLFVIGVLSGCRTIYLVNRGSWLVNMQQCPPLITIWVYTVVQLDLLPAVLSLGAVGIYVWWKGLSIQV